MRLGELIYRCINIYRDAYIKLISRGIILFEGYVKNIPDIYKHYEVRYFEYVGDNSFVITLY